VVSVLVWKPIIGVILIHFTFSVLIQGVHFTVPVSTAALVGALSLRSLPASARNLVCFCHAFHLTLLQRILSKCSKSRSMQVSVW